MATLYKYLQSITHTRGGSRVNTDFYKVADGSVDGKKERGSRSMATHQSNCHIPPTLETGLFGNSKKDNNNMK